MKQHTHVCNCARCGHKFNMMMVGFIQKKVWHPCIYVKEIRNMIKIQLLVKLGALYTTTIGPFC